MPKPWGDRELSMTWEEICAEDARTHARMQWAAHAYRRATVRASRPSTRPLYDRLLRVFERLRQRCHCASGPSAPVED